MKVYPDQPYNRPLSRKKHAEDSGGASLLAASLRHQTKEFFNNSTLHGVRYIAEKDRPFCEKFMWFSFTAVGAVTTCIIIVSLWEKFQTNPTITGESSEDQGSPLLVELEPIPSTSSGYTSARQTFMPQLDMDFSSDDSVEDPHYVPASNIEPAMSSSSGEETTNRESSNITVSPKKSIRNKKKDKKLKRNLGLSYKTLKGKVIAGKVLKELRQCRMKCKERIPLSEREALFKEYWQMGSYEKRSSYMASLMEIEDKATQRLRTEDPDSQKFRLKTYKYFFVIHGKREPVCRGCLLKTLDE